MNRLLITLVFILSSCSGLPDRDSVTKNNPLMDSLANVDTEGFTRADSIKEFKFPEDHFAHEDFKSEWWYFTGNLEDQNGRKFGYQFTIFRNALYPQTELTQGASNWKTNQVYMGHFGLTDIKANKFYSFELLEREAIGLAGITEDPFKIWVGNWSLESESIFPMEIKAAKDGVSLNLTVSPKKAITLQGDSGLSQKSPEAGNASYYYSITRLESNGEITIQENKYKVTGESWMDREWSTSALSKEQEGWDWFALQLNDNTELMYYQLRNKDGSVGETSGGSFIKSNGQKIRLGHQELELKVLDYWSSKKYPAKWSLKIPSLKLDLTIEPFINKQEHQFHIPYWEGAVKVSGNKRGRGYVELTGY